MVGPPPDHSRPFAARELLRAAVTAGMLPDLRREARAVALAYGLTGQRLSDWITAVNELMTNAISHGGGSGQLRCWEEGSLVCEVSDNGPGFPAGSATIGPRPRPTAAGGRGLWIAQQMTDALHIDSGPAGTTARISIREPS